MAPVPTPGPNLWLAPHAADHCPAMSRPRVPPPPPSVLGMNVERPFSCAGPDDTLSIDQACLTVNNSGGRALTLWAQSDECQGVSTLANCDVRHVEKMELVSGCL